MKKNIIGFIICCIVIFTRCIREKPREALLIVNPDGQRYAGDESCKRCHQAIYASFLSTAHFLTSRVAERKYIKGSFAGGSEAGGNVAGGSGAGENVAGARNEFDFDPHWKVVMEEHADGLFQTAYHDGQRIESERFDIVMGSGKKGQTYIYSKGKELYQLPISYFTSSHSWANSPGYAADQPFFERPIEARCMQCHTSFARQLSSNEYDPDRILYGVGCERCHGPAGKHVDYQGQHPEDRKGKFIVNPAALARQQSLDVCALCHSGVMRSIAPAWSFLPGDTLSHYFDKNSAHIDSVNLDVHANQYGLLTASKCFRISGTMVCSTCHNTHVKENGDMSAYGQKCMSCHAPANHNFCTMTAPPGFSMQANCVNCHMPVRASRNLSLLVAGHATATPEMVRSHRIAIYRDVTEIVLKKNQ
jgi:hypothetical protein